MSAAPVTRNPFPGLRPFTQEEDYLFFGREEQTIELLQRLGSNRFVAVVGTSGSGKSSLVRCGLLSELLGGRMLEAGASWEIAVTHPGGNPLALLTDALLEADLYDRDAEHARENLLATLSRSHFGLVEAVKQAGLHEGTNFLLVVDQFEEIFRFHEAGQRQQEAANEFVSLLLEAVGQKEAPIYVVLTMRSDFIGECGQFEGLAEMVNRGEFLIPRLNREQYKRVIEGPIKVAGGQIAPRLLQRLLNDLGQQADQLPCLQHALMRTWDVWALKGDSEALDLDDYQRVGKMSQALSLHADEIFESLAGDRQRELCQAMFQALTVEESNSRGIRRPQRLGRLCEILEVPAERLLPIIDAYRQSGVTFLMPSPGVELTDQTIVDISHESLMRVWVRLRQWVEEETQAAGIYVRLSESADLNRQGKAGLYRDPELGIALAWRESRRPNAAWAERYRGGFATAIKFLEASQQESVAEEQAREAARQRELEQAQQLAEAQQLRLEQQQRAARKLRAMIGGLAVVAIVAAIACAAALVANKRANDLASVARQKEAAAQASALEADRERKTALRAQQATEKALTQVESQKAEVESSLNKATQAEEAGRKLLYTTDMRLAPFIWRDDRTSAQKLRTLLAKHIPSSERMKDEGGRSPEERMKDEGGRMKGENTAAEGSDSSFILHPSSFQRTKSDLRGFEWYYYQHLLEENGAVFSGHAFTVADGAFSANGELVTLDQNGQVRRWNLDSQVEVQASRRDLPGGLGAQRTALSSDGRLAALAEGNLVHVLNTSTGKEIFQIDSGRGQGRGLIFTPDGGRLVIIDTKIRWCAADSGEVIASVDREASQALPAEGQTPAAGSVMFAYYLGLGRALSADGLTLAVVGHGMTGNQFSIFRLDAAKQTVTPLAKDVGTAGTLSAAALSPEGRLLAVGAKLSGSISVYDTVAGRPIAQHGSAHASPVSAIAFAGEGFRLVTADVEGTIKVWADARKLTSTSAAAATLKGHEAAITHVGFSSTGRQLVSTSADKTARVWDMDKSGLVVRALERSGSACYATRFSADGQWIAAADGPSVRLWDAATGKLVRELSSGGKGRVFSVAFSPTDNRLLAVGYGGQTDVSYVALWDIDAGRELARLPGASDLADFSLNENSGAVGALAFSPDGKYLVAGFGSPGLIAPSRLGVSIFTTPLKVWEVATRRLFRRLIGHGGYCVSLDFSKDGSRLASGSRDGTVILWSTETWKATRTLRNGDADSMYSSVYSQAGMVEDAAFSPDGKSLAMASREGTVQLFNVATGGLLLTLKGHSGAVSALAFSPDGRTLATGGSDQTIRLWNAETGRELMQMDFGDALLEGVETLAFSPGGKQLLAGGKSTAIWSAAPVVWNDPDRAALKLRSLLQSNALFQSRIRMLSENLRLHEALAKLDAKDVRVRAALAAAQANWQASRQAWPEAAGAFDRLRAADPATPEDWLRTPGLLRLATALLHENRPRDAAALLSGGARRRAEDGLPVVLQAGAGVQDAATGELLEPLRALIKERLGREPRNPGLLELRAELAGQWSDTKAQLTDYTAATEELARQKPQPMADLGRLYGRRGNAHVALGQWQLAVDDYARGATDATTDLALLSNQALALYQIHGDGQGLLRLVERHPKLASSVGDLFIQGKDWSRAVEIYSRGITPETTDAQLLSKRARGHEALKNWDAAVADWSRAAAGNLEGARLLEEFGRRLAEGGQVPLANGQFEKARALYERLLKSDAENDVVAGELARLLIHQHENAHPTSWTVLEPTEMKSSGGATLTLKPDRSILAGGKNPDRDVYTLAAKTDLEHITAIQLEALCDPSLPSTGPGRASGDFHLNEFRVFSAGQPAPLSNISVAYDRTRYDQESIREAIDGKVNDALAWGNCAGPGQTNTAVIATQLNRARSDDLKFELDFLPSCGLGCFRLSVCGDPAAFEREERRFAVTQLSDPWLRLAAAYAINGRDQPALEYFGRAFQRADGYEARMPIIELIARFDDLLLAFVRQRGEDPQLQLARARTLAARGQKRLAAKQPREALTELQESRAIFTRLRAKFPAPWAVLTPADLESTGGETMAVESDGSIFVSGPNPERAVYTLKGRTDLSAVKAICLETIPDARLPQGGAGRYPANGNFHVSEFTAAIESDGKKSKPTPIDISSATADYHLRPSELYAPRNMIDGDPKTRWDTDNGDAKRRQAHWAVFALKSPVRTGGGYLSITLDSGITSWGHHGLGRFRLSVTNEQETIAQTPLRHDLKDSEFAELNVALGKAYVQQGQANLATLSFSEAVFLASDGAAKAKIIAAAAPLQGVLEKLSEAASLDAQFQAELARHYDGSGNGPLASVARTKALALVRAKLAKEPENSGLAAELAGLLLEEHVNGSSAGWTVLKPTEMKSEGGATLTLLDDNSILAGGKNPDRDVYTVVAKPGLEHIAAIRLEALPDPSLPHKGPGRQPANGNFYLNELRVIAGGAPVALSGSAVDYDEFSESQKIIDGKIDGFAGWANAARAGQANTAIVSTELHRSPNDELRIELHSPSPIQSAQHNLGRFRLSVSGDPAIFARQRRRLAAMKLADPWARLAVACHIAHDQPALDALLKAHPEAATSTGDLYAADNKWDQAVAAYTQAITPKTTGATLLAKRAEAYEKLKQWDLAAADWTKVIEQQSAAAVDRFKPDDFRLWQLGISNGGAGSMEVVDGALVITTTAATGTNWHVKIFKAPVQLENGVEYVIRFKMKSPDSCSVSVYGQIHQEDWHGIGLQETFNPPSEFMDYEFPFIPHDATPANNSISFQFGVNRGRVMIKEIVIGKKRDVADTALLAKRAAVYVAAEKWDLALAEWRQVVAHQPALLQSAYDQFQKADRFGEATEFGLQLVKAMPQDELVWLRVAPVLVLAGDEAVYSEFCDRMARQFAATKDPVVAERVVKAALLRPKSIDLGKLRGEILAKSLDDGTTPDWFAPWGFGSRALLAYRSGDAESAVKYMKRSEELKPEELPHAMNLSVRAMAEHQLRHPEEARRALEAASQLINRLQADAKYKGIQPPLDVQILYREAEALLSGKTKP